MELIWVVTLISLVVGPQRSASAIAKKKTETIISAGDWVSVDAGSGTFNNKWDFFAFAMIFVHVFTLFDKYCFISYTMVFIHVLTFQL